MVDIKQAFKKFSRANFFSRVDNTHILELHLGLDEQGRKSIEFRGQYHPRRVTGTASILVTQYEKPEYNTLRFSLCEEDVSGLFYTFCEDLIEWTRPLREKADGYTATVNRFYQWKKMFVPSSGNLLSEPEIMGLTGEILYLRGSLAERIGLEGALDAWSGQELTHKDFSFGSSWSEVKTVRSNAQTVKISSLEQLDSHVEGELAVYFLEKMSAAYDGTTLNKLVIETRNMFSAESDKDRFLSKVMMRGYEYNNYYDDFVFEITNFVRFSVIPGFPRLTAANVNHAIRKASYEISLTAISEFRICHQTQEADHELSELQS